MTLAKYIHDLLFRYECVIVPDFGGFLTKTISAVINEETNTLHPPTKKLGFNSQLTENDGLLANYISSVDQIPYEAALNFIDFEVKEWQKKLNNENLVLEDIGYFSLNDENKLQFEPDTKTNFLTDSFGLDPLMIPEIKRLEPLREEVVFDLITGDISDKEVYLNTDYRRKKLTPFISYAALFALLFAVGYFLTQVIIKQNNDLDQVAKLQEDQEAMINKRIQEATFEINKTLPEITLKMDDVNKINDANTEAKEIDYSSSDNNAKISNDTTEEEVAQETKTFEEKVDATDNSNSVETKEEEPNLSDTNTSKHTNSSETSVLKYHIIAGAFSQPANADKKVNQLKEKGYNARIVGMNKWNLTQVAFGSFATREEAQKFLRKIKNTEAKDAWILVK